MKTDSRLFWAQLSRPSCRAYDSFLHPSVKNKSVSSQSISDLLIYEETLLMITNSKGHSMIICDCPAGFHRTPWSVSSRLVVTSLYTLGTVVLGAYSAALFSCLVLDVPLLPFNSLEEMLLNPQGYSLGMPSILQINSTPVSGPG